MEYGSEFDWRANAAFVKADTGFVRGDWQLFRSGRDALKALARLARPRRVLLPALCCESMISPFVQNGCETVFYRLNADLSADGEDVLQKLGDGALLLYMPYFGVRPFSEAFLRGLRESGRGLLLVEDRTQDILTPRPEGGFVPDATVASLRKWAALPDGGMLTGRLGSCPAASDSAFGDLRRTAMEKKSRYLAAGGSALKRDFLEELARASAMLDADAAPVAMSAAYRELLAELDFAAVYAARVRNLRRLRLDLEPLLEAGRLRLLSPEPEKSALYFPILLENRDAVQRAMAARDVYCPVIWPEPAEAAGVCPVSRSVVDGMLAIPCDQRYTEADMDFIAACLAESLRETA